MRALVSIALLVFAIFLGIFEAHRAGDAVPEAACHLVCIDETEFIPVQPETEPIKVTDNPPVPVPEERRFVLRDRTIEPEHAPPRALGC